MNAFDPFDTISRKSRRFIHVCIKAGTHALWTQKHAIMQNIWVIFIAGSWKS